MDEMFLVCDFFGLGMFSGSIEIIDHEDKLEQAETAGWFWIQIRSENQVSKKQIRHRRYQRILLLLAMQTITELIDILDDSY